jgi:hypothetical protein
MFKHQKQSVGEAALPAKIGQPDGGEDKDEAQAFHARAGSGDNDGEAMGTDEKASWIDGDIAEEDG